MSEGSMTPTRVAGMLRLWAEDRYGLEGVTGVGFEPVAQISSRAGLNLSTVVTVRVGTSKRQEFTEDDLDRLKRELVAFVMKACA